MARTFVKIRLTDGENSERIWAEVVSNDAGALRVRLDNEPVCRGYSINEVVTVQASDVLDAMQVTSATPPQQPPFSHHTRHKAPRQS